MTADPRPLSPRAEAKRAQLRAAAQTLFLTRGFSRTSTDAIASAAGVSKETLYRHYPRKEDLLQDVLRHFFAEAMSPALLDRLGQQDDLEAVFGTLARSVLGHIMTLPYLALLRVIVSEAPQQPELAELFQTTVPVQGLRAIRALLEGAHARGLIPALDFEAAARLFIGWVLTYALIDGLFVLDGPPRMPSAEQQENIVRLFVKAIL